MAATSTTVPSTFDMWVTATSLVRGPIASITACGSRSPFASTSTQRSTAPQRSRTKFQGTMLAWCSMTESTISSPGSKRGMAQE